MKRLLFYSLLLASFSAFGQNWRPLHTGQEYGFAYAPPSSDGDSLVYILKTVPPVLRANGDSLWAYPLNIVDSACQIDTVSKKLLSYSLFGTSVAYGGSSVTFYQEVQAHAVHDSLVLRIDLAAGTTYSSGSHNVTYQGTTLDTVLGQIDSVRAYEVDSGTARWSKMFGIYSLPALLTMRSVGCEIRAGQQTNAISLPGRIGMPLPNVENIYAFQPGDSIGFNFLYNGLGAMPPDSDGTSRYRFTSRRVDTAARLLILGYLRSVNRYTWFPSQHLKAVFNEPGEWRLNLDSTFATGQLFTVAGTDEFINETRYNLYRVWQPLQITHYSGGRQLTLSSGNAYPFIDSSSCLSEPPIDGDAGDFNVQLGIGPDAWFLYDNHVFADCYKLQGVGTSCSPLLTSDQPVVSASYRLAQNPITSQLEVLSPTPLHLTLQDLQGHTLAEGFETKTLSTQTLPAGIYMLRVQDKQGRTGTLRVIRQ